VELREGEIILLCKIEFPVDVGYLVRGVHVFGCRFVVNTTHNKRRPVTSEAVLYFYQDLYVYSAIFTRR